MPGRLSRRESLYLDLLRGAAALIVVYGHAVLLFGMPHVALWGHQAVVLFFVLSGYVICHVADTREASFREFVIARLARLWSVLLPALLLTIACDAVGRRFGHDLSHYATVPIDWPVLRIAAAFTFLSETWFSIMPWSNGATWSLCLEFWYYMLFAAWVFLPRGPGRTLLLVLFGLLAGFKGLLLLPVWLMGTALQRATRLRAHAAWIDYVLWSTSAVFIGVIAVLRIYEPAISLMSSIVGPWVLKELAEARVFWMDWVFGAAIFVHLLSARVVVERLPLELFARPLRACANVSFAMYLFHMPLLFLLAAFLPPGSGWLAIILTVGTIGILGGPVERSKKVWRSALDAMVDRLSSAAIVPTGQSRQTGVGPSSSELHS